MKNNKMLLRGFDKASQPLAEQILARAGYTLATTLTTAEVVVVGPLGFNTDTLGPDPKKAVEVLKRFEGPEVGGFGSVQKSP